MNDNHNREIIHTRYQRITVLTEFNNLPISSVTVT